MNIYLTELMTVSGIKSLKIARNKMINAQATDEMVVRLSQRSKSKFSSSCMIINSIITDALQQLGSIMAIQLAIGLHCGHNCKPLDLQAKL
jgi:riboflavin synthase